MKATLVKYNGGWGNAVRKMNEMDALKWLSKNGYTASKAHDIKHDIGKDTIELIVVGRQVEYHKKGCNTFYTLTVIFERDAEFHHCKA